MKCKPYAILQLLQSLGLSGVKNDLSLFGCGVGIAQRESSCHNLRFGASSALKNDEYSHKSKNCCIDDTDSNGINLYQ
jgi:hypothetical protein